MFGDVDTVSENTNGDGHSMSDPSSDWAAPATESLAPSSSWGQDWATPSTRAASQQTWEIAAHSDDSASEPAAFAGWGALSTTDSAALTHDLSSWDSPTDAVVAETSPAPWAVEASSDAPQWSALSGWGTSVETAAVQATSHQAHQPSGPDVEPSNVESGHEQWNDHAAQASAHPTETSHEQWNEHAAQASAHHPTETSHEQWNEHEVLGQHHGDDVLDRSDGDLAERPAVDIWADAPPSPTLPASFLSGTVNGEPDSSGVPFHEIAAALASADAVPLAARTSPAAVATLHTDETEAVTDDALPAKRRGRLAARNAREALAKNAAEAVAEQAAILSIADETSESATVAPRVKSGKKFFAKKDPIELADAASPARETPKVIRIAALVSLLVGVGLFAFTVINGRSSDSTPEIAPTVPNEPTVPVASVTVAPAPVVASTVPVADPIFGAAAPADVSVPVPAPTAPVSVEQSADDDLSFSDPGDFSN